MIERKPNSAKYRIVGKGITVDFLAQFMDDSEWPVERICENYGLTMGEVFAAWSFYADHQAEIDAQIAGENALTVFTSTDTEKRARLLKRLA